MIYTLTLSPAIDVYYKDSNFKVGAINRPTDFYYLPGGKGINVTRVLNNLGRDSIALGFNGGASGIFLEQLLKEHNISFDFVNTDVPTRINTKINGLRETALNAPRGKILVKDYDALGRKLLKLKKNDVLVISGAMPAEIPMKGLNKTLKVLKDKGVLFVFDVTRDSLIKLLPFKPFLIKPNKFELEEFFCHKMKSENEIVKYANRFLKMGVSNVLISLGKDGAMLINSDGMFRLKAPKGKMVKTVGAGDSMVAGFIDGYLSTNNVYKAFKRGVAAGSATAFSKDLATKKEVNALMRLMIKNKKEKVDENY